MRRALTTLKSKNEKPTNEALNLKNKLQRSSAVIPAPTSLLQARNDTDASAHPNDDTIHVRVGQSNDARLFRLKRHLLAGVSAHFNLAISRNVPDPIELPHDDPEAFVLFTKWVESQESHVPYEPLCYSDEPWLSKAADAWILAKNIKADTFETYALSQFIVNCALVDVSTWEMIERKVQERSTLRRFCNHWLAWNCWLAAPAESEYSGLQGARFQGVVTDDTRDPRTFDIHHWYDLCGDEINPTCDHDPAKRRMQIVAATRASKTKYSEWGRDWELKNDSSRSESTKTT